MNRMRLCPDCGGRVVGRTDKKFCSNECKNSYHNKEKCIENKSIKEVNRILTRNRKILLSCVNSKKRQISENYLAARGFNFSFFTHQNRSSDGELAHFCYEVGYQRDEGRSLRLLKEDCINVYRMRL
jgi:DNA-directed RNA polymerase subunit M/transcription elongation factor TFIIS